MNDSRSTTVENVDLKMLVLKAEGKLDEHERPDR